MTDERSERRRALHEIVSNMSEEEFPTSLEKAGIELYKTGKTTVFSEQAFPGPRRGVLTAKT